MIRKALIHVKQSFASKDAIIEFVAEAARKEGVLEDKMTFVEAVYQREREISTSVGYGIAIPHGKTDVVKEPFISFISLKEPFEWDAEQKDQVEAVFLIGVPETNTEMLHLKAIAAISRKLMDETFRQNLYACATNQEAYNMLDEIDKSIREA